MSTATDVLIIGGGIIGCAIAERLADAGLKVTVVEKGQPGKEASWAAAGMLAPYAEVVHHVSPVLAALFEESHKLYAEWVARLQQDSGQEIGYQTGGSLMVAADFQEAEILAGLLDRMQLADKPIQDLSSGELKKLQPGLADCVQSGLFFPRDSYVNNRELMQALVTSATVKGVTFLANTKVLNVETAGSRATGVKTTGGGIAADRVVIAAGCWSPQIDLDLTIPVRPVRGQIVHLHVEKQFLRRLVHSTGCYIVPWPDGRTLVGSTLENVGYNRETSAAGIQQLLAAAIATVPALGAASVRQTWAGLRPDTSDNLPILGSTPYDNLFVATGHFRNGILLAPITAKLISELILTGNSPGMLHPFRLARFD